jgi:hypothetical protein
MSCTGYNPPHVEQLHGPDPTAGSDCAIAVAKMAIRFATCGVMDPGMDQLREDAGLDVPNPPPSDYSTTMSEYQRLINSQDERARDRGFEGLTANATERGRWNELEEILKAEKKWTAMFVQYSILNDREPSKSGDPNFDGAHAIGVYGYKSSSETDDGTVKFKVYDPLCDGRKASIPKGPTWWKAATLRDAADAYAGGGDGTATWCVTPRAESLVAAEPDATWALTDARDLLCELRGWLRDNLPDNHRGAKLLFRDISEYLGGNREGLSLPVHSGVTPDDAG